MPKKPNNIQLKFEVNKEDYSIKGLELVSFEIKNNFSSLNQLASLSWNTNPALSTRHQFSARVKGIYCATKAQQKLLSMSASNKAFSIELYISQLQKIKGKCLISHYELISDFDEFVKFDLTLLNSGPIEIMEITIC